MVLSVHLGLSCAMRFISISVQNGVPVQILRSTFKKLKFTKLFEGITIFLSTKFKR